MCAAAIAAALSLYALGLEMTGDVGRERRGAAAAHRDVDLDLSIDGELH